MTCGDIVIYKRNGIAGTYVSVIEAITGGKFRIRPIGHSWHDSAPRPYRAVVVNGSRIRPPGKYDGDWKRFVGEIPEAAK